LAGSSISPEALHAALSEAHREQREGKTKFDRAATTSARRKSNDKKKSSSGSRKRYCFFIIILYHYIL